MVRAIAKSRFRFNGQWINRGQSLEMSETEFAEHSCSNAGAASNLVMRDERAEEPEEEDTATETRKGRYHRRDMRPRQ